MKNVLGAFLKNLIRRNTGIVFMKTASKTLLAMAFFSSLFFSCDVGLGESVDVMAPTVSISYPPASSVIKEQFCLAGSWTDDKGVMLINVSVKNNDTGAEVFSGAANLGMGDWSIMINSQNADGTWQLKDGKYTADVVAMDTSKRISGTSSRTFEIDNTPPVFVITNPATIDANNPSAYGSIFKVNGSIAESHIVKKMTVKILDPVADSEGNNRVLAEWSESNVNTAGGTSVTFARYDESKADELHNNYASIYTSPDSKGNQKFLCSVYLSDNALVYRSPDSGSASSDVGNSTTCLWLNDSIYGSDAGENDLLSKNANPQYEIGDFMKILNGTYSGDCEKANKVLAATKIDTTDNNSHLALTLNKDANPTYSFLGYSFTDVDADKNKISKSSSITFKAECGKNETPFKPSKIKVYLVGPFKPEGTENPLKSDVIESIYSNIASYLADKTENIDYIVLYDGEQQYTGSSTSSWTESMVLPDNIEAGSYYILAASGTDMDDIEFVSNNGSRFGFIGITSGSAPTVLISKPAVADLSKDFGSAAALLSEIKGTVESGEAAIASARYEIVVSDLMNSKKLGIINGNATILAGANELKSVNYVFDATEGEWNAAEDENGNTVSVTVDPRTAAANSGILYQYQIVVYGKDVGGAEGKAAISPTVDTIAPVINNISVTPVAETDSSSGTERYKVNGKVKVIAKVEETNLSSIELEVSDPSGAKITKTVSPSAFVQEEIATSNFPAGNSADDPITVKITVTDSAGNTGTGTNIDYIVNQTTDIPKVTFMGELTDTDLVSKDEITSGKNLFLTTDKIMGSITDDDKIDSVRIQYRKDESVEWADLLNVSGINKASYSLSQTLTKNGSYLAEGTYQLKVSVTDKKDDGSASVTKEIGPFWIGIDEGNPKLSFDKTSQSGAYSNTGVVKSVKGFVSDSSGYVSLQRYPTKEDALNKTNAEQFCDSNGTLLEDANGNPLTVKEYKTSVASDDGEAWVDCLKIPDGATEGRTVWYLVTDKYGRTETYSWRYKIDGTKPTVHSDWTDTNTMTAWSSSASRTYKIPLSDSWDNINSAVYGDASGIETVVLTVTDTTENPVTAEYTMKLKEVYNSGATDKDSNYFFYEYTVPFTQDGEYKVQIKVTDSAGNVAKFPSDSTYYSAKIDTTAAVVTDFKCLIDGVEVPEGTTPSLKASNNDKFKITANIADVNAGILSVVAMDKNTAVEGASVTPVVAPAAGATPTLYTITFPASACTTGVHEFGLRVTDNANNAYTKTVAVAVDVTAPKAFISGYTPTTTYNDEEVVNGVIVVSGTASDETALGTTNAVNWELLNSSNAQVKAGSLSITGGISSAWNFAINTAEKDVNDASVSVIPDGTYTLKVKVFDAAENTSEIVSTTFKVVQASDLPVIKVGNEIVDTTVSNYTVAYKDKNMFTDSGMNIAVTDDDGIDSVLVEYSADGGATFNTLVAKDGDCKTSVNFTANIQEKGTGEYKIRVTAKDKKENITVGGTVYSQNSVSNYVPGQNSYFAIVVDKDTPYLTAENSGAFRKANTEITVSGKIKDSTGEVKIIRADNADGTGNPVEIGTVSDCSAEQKDWSDTLTTMSAAGTKKFYYIATDKYGRQSSIDYEYTIDLQGPTFADWVTSGSITDENKLMIDEADGKTVGGVKYVKKNTFTFKIPVSDSWVGGTKVSNVSGIESVTLVVNNGSETTEAAMSVGAVYVQDSAEYRSGAYNYYSVTQTLKDGVNNISIKSRDKAGNESTYVNTYSFNVDIQSPVLAVTSPVSVAEYNTSEIVFAGTVSDGNFDKLVVTGKRTSAEYDSSSRKTKSVTSTIETEIAVTDDSWNWTLPGDGAYANLKFTAYDKAENSSVSEMYNFVVDTENPKLVSVTDVSRWLNVNTQTYKVLVGDWGETGNKYSSGIESVVYSVEGSEPVQMAQGGLRDANGTDTGDLLYYEYSTAFNGLADGKTSYTITAKDAVKLPGNQLSVMYKIDTHAPSVDAEIALQTDTDKTKYQRKADDSAVSYEIKVTPDDTNGEAAVSGLKEVSVKINGSTKSIYEDASVGTAKTEITLSETEEIKTLSGGTKSIWIKATDLSEGKNTVSLTVTDYAGNKTEKEVYFYLDSSAPTVEYTSHAAGASVNKKVDISGRVSDELKVTGTDYPSGISDTEAIVQWAETENSASWTTLTKTTAYTEVSYNAANATWTLSGLDTTKINSGKDSKECYIRVVFTDNYGNKSSGSLKLTVDQDADRPVIELTTITAMNDVIPLKKVSGTISDDDGVSGLKMWIIESGSWTDTTKVPTASEDNGWTPVVVNASGTWTVENIDESEHSWLFYIIDNKNGKFWTQVGATGNTLLSVPYLTLNSVKSDNTSALAFKVDTQAPQITMYISNQELAATSDKWQAAGTVFGGTENKLYIKLLIQEQNMVTASGTGYALPSLKIGTKTPTVALLSGASITVDETTTPYTYTYLLAPITLDKTSYSSIEGSVTVKATLSDQSGQEGQGGTNIILDYSAPSVGILSPTATISDAVSAEVTIKGIVTDSYSSIKKMEYVIPLKNTAYSESEGTWASVNVSSASWEIEFPSGSAETQDSLLYYAVNDTQYEGVSDISGSLGIYKVPLYFRVTDGVGNIGVISVDENNTPLNYVYVDPDGAKPKAWINSPETGTVTNGVVTVFGGASDNISVSKVCIQVDVNGDGEIDSSDRDLLAASDEALCKSIFGAAATINEASADSNWYILAEGTNSWKCAIDTTTEFATMQSTVTKNGFTLNKDSKYLIVQVRAIDNDGNTRAWTAPNYIQLDSSAPWFTDIALVQFGSGNAASYEESERITQQDYISGQYLSNVTATANGKWYLAVTVEANSSITSVTASAETSTTVNILPLAEDGTTVFVADSAVANYAFKDNDKKYRLLIPLKTSESGMISATLNAVNSANGTGTQSIKINIDSTAPSLYTTSGAQTYAAEGNLRIKSNGSSKNLGTNLDTNSVIENSNGYFNLGDKVMESGSGLDLVAFFFNKNSYIYDSMINAGNGTYETFYISSSAGEGSLYINADHMPAYCLSGVSRPTSDSFSVSSSKMTSAAYKHVRKGGLVKIAGTYHKIKEVSDYSSTISVTFAPSVSTAFNDVEIIFAQIVDNMGDETFDSAWTSDYEEYRLLKNDDGDGMCETISQTSSVYTWNAYVNSNNIIDGNISLNIVAMDKAGNISYGNVVSVVANNRPRITKVFLGTDLNGSGKYDFDADEAPVIETGKKGTADGISYGEFNYYSAYNRQNGNAVTAKVLASSAFKVISGLCIVPEFIGGNGSLKYNITTVPDLSASGILAPNSSDSLESMISRSSLNINNKGALPLFGNTAISGDGDNENAVAYDVTDNSKVSKVYAEDGTTVINTYGSVSYSDFGGIELDSNDALISGEGQKNLKITFWDNTDGAQASFGGQWATLVVPVTIKSAETVPPVPKITPFYWASGTDNSVYIKESGDSSASIKGHIELEGTDLLTDSSYTSGLPKVSGKIKIEGTVFDDVRLESISMSVFGGTNTKIASYENGEWVNEASFPTGLVSFSATDKDISQNGHTVSYVAVIDTEQLSVSGYPVGKNQSITISATDWKANASTAGSTQTASGALTDCYKMDVVPYVTEIVTHLSSFYKQAPSVYARTALGHYPVYEGETIQFAGYNLGTNKAKVTISGMSATTLASGTVGGETVSNTITLTKNTISETGAKSGSVSVTVNSIPALNNLNENDALGSYQGSVSDDSYANAYNRQPNGVNNNTLTDDLYLDVWQFKNAAEPVSGGASYVTMKINPKTGIPGFSYANSILYFNMPGYNANNSESSWGADNDTLSGSSYSQIPFGMNYGGFSHNSFTFDSYGYAYGAAMCTDTQSATASAFLQFFSRETPIPYNTYDQNMNYCNAANASRLDSSSVQVSSGSSGWTTDIDRIQSISMDTSYSGGSSTAPTTSNPVYVFMAYYDQPVKQVRFRWGTVGGATDNIDGKKNSSSSSISSSDRPSSYTYGLDDVVGSEYTGFAQSRKTDGSTRPKEITESYRQYSTSHSSVPVQIVAASGITSTWEEYSTVKNGGAGKYVSLSIANKDTAKPVAIVTWYDSVNMALKMAYNTDPTTSNSWTVRTIDPNGGINVKTVVDKDNHIHFAYYDNINGSDLKYAYLDSYNSSSEPEIVTVDSFSAVGAKCTIDVAKDSSGNWVPYIGYQLSSYLGTPLGAKVAYRTDFTSLGDGATKDMYTGQWECSIVPTQNIPNDDQINVGLRRDENGFAKKFRDSDYWSSGDTAPGETIYNKILKVGNATILHGNNTANPIIGYGIDTGAIEMAQKK